jgi:hypothetical protein
MRSTDMPERIYYATEPRKATLTELLRVAPSSFKGRCSAILVKALQIKNPAQSGMAYNSVERCSVEDIPDLINKFNSTIGVLATLGFSPAIAMRLPVLGEGSCSSLALLGSIPTVYAIILYGRMPANGQEQEEFGLSFVSRSATTVWATSNAEQRLNDPPMFDVKHFPRHSPESLYSEHMTRIKSVPANSLRRFDADSLWNSLVEVEAMVTEFNVARGVLRPMTQAEMRAVSGEASKKG